MSPANTSKSKSKKLPQWICRTGIGQDSHRFLPESSTKPCILGGVIFENTPGFQANSDGDVIFHAVCNAISSITHKIILGEIADKLLHTRGITDSSVYLEEALKSLKPTQAISHIAITLEGKRPKFRSKFSELRQSIGNALKIPSESVGITATSGEGLSDYGCGDGIQCICILTVMEYRGQ
ncbi:2-C-methyl-D-erythritol 2,4-cyclodiphosphate synthase [Chlamydia pecorum]|uniref:2-C-methyl-D-erythritol 2,4-cyclodiphosphate synthase n=1 Tax=Chlamydia pecorum (strain ATCC VR-628 / DSM 29919 / E58) TaxID=331635 RepID=A0AA34WHX1_CHLPE|nr:2-C-methyl-D-erythritol 2,4-cyclodiphosphate synthase [Chlamydia pecorum]AEB41498.1 2C-methyl-D-erythritol 2,4-cyclodiphosphate synthase [Chlamydia pecorum E58]UFP07050.1 2-C-methyl-D-erythritol 2,4-cyclodiphosphate synthase [Chlamydia pecorum]UJT76873.1 2C-methyl-D-erythritol 2,4-cyclodiphosphate synthase [Chlamydia pecorum]